MPRPIVHIGYHKTATTWFQKHFYPCVRNARFVARERVRDEITLRLRTWVQLF